MITDIQAKDIKRLLLRVYRRYNTGAITEAQAYKETYPVLILALRFFFFTVAGSIMELPPPVSPSARMVSPFAKGSLM